jgi:nucleoside 2-deoxyribosyltransferase
MIVYLAGFLGYNTIEDCMRWRRSLCEYYGVTEMNITFIDPMSGVDPSTVTDGGLKCHIPPHALVHRDYDSVASSDLIIANLDTFGEDRGLCGTLCELAWAWDKHIPIIVITTEDKYIHHPFISYFASAMVGSVEELLESKYIEYFYAGTVTTKY